MGSVLSSYLGMIRPGWNLQPRIIDVPVFFDLDPFVILKSALNLGAGYLRSAYFVTGAML
jgi:hypothetical protein